LRTTFFPRAFLPRRFFSNREAVFESAATLSQILAMRQVLQRTKIFPDVELRR